MSGEAAHAHKRLLLRGHECDFCDAQWLHRYLALGATSAAMTAAKPVEKLMSLNNVSVVSHLAVQSTFAPRIVLTPSAAQEKYADGSTE